ncbi:MAG: hypothetical protein LBI43_00365 [Streptococcaceae bacterium]|jgi:hypothetical protein|nr:hypothetical protein [Streptococcaceae bacterium]
MVTGQISLTVQIVGISLMILIPLIFIWWIWGTIVAPLLEKLPSRNKKSDFLRLLGLWFLGFIVLGILLAGFYFLGVKGMALIAVVACPPYLVLLSKKKSDDRI